MVNEKPEALRLADWLDHMRANGTFDYNSIPKAAAELRRLHAENEDFRATCDHLTRENAGQIGEIVALKEQRDELLEALMRIDSMCEKPIRYSSIAVQEFARAAIAKATGETK